MTKNCRMFGCTAVVLAALAASGCGQQHFNAADVTGATLGGALGGYVGHQIGGGLGQVFFTASGALLGGAAGYMIARRFAPSDRAMYSQTLAESLDTSNDGEIRYWSNPETGLSGTIRPVRSFHRGEENQLCRDYRSAVNFEMDVATGSGTACRAPDGQWIPLAAAFG
ncbi:MAG: glycine zipper 2TM domain-containing protein [Rhodospirillales bacterium]|nr:glycine zipper 2TM domain-containing protein [Rhodospirillales bacterium]